MQTSQPYLAWTNPEPPRPAFMGQTMLVLIQCSEPAPSFTGYADHHRTGTYRTRGDAEDAARFARGY